MMGYTAFKLYSADPAATVDIARFYDSGVTGTGTKRAHEIGWTIRVRKVGQGQEFGYFHVHWKPRESDISTFERISAHFKESHKGNKSSNRNTNEMDLKPLAALMYNGLRMLNAKWDAYAPNKPKTAATGWTNLATRITTQMVDQFKKNNNAGALTILGQNPLYDLSKWDQEAWNSFLDWLVG